MYIIHNTAYVHYWVELKTFFWIFYRIIIDKLNLRIHILRAVHVKTLIIVCSCDIITILKLYKFNLWEKHQKPVYVMCVIVRLCVCVFCWWFASGSRIRAVRGVNNDARNGDLAHTYIKCECINVIFFGFFMSTAVITAIMKDGKRFMMILWTDEQNLDLLPFTCAYILWQ